MKRQDSRGRYRLRGGRSWLRRIPPLGMASSPGGIWRSRRVSRLELLPPNTKMTSQGAVVSTSVLITGGAGFIGSHVSEAYVRAGYHVTVLDDLSRGRRENVPQGAEFVHADIRSLEA